MVVYEAVIKSRGHRDGSEEDRQLSVQSTRSRVSSGLRGQRETTTAMEHRHRRLRWRPTENWRAGGRPEEEHRPWSAQARPAAMAILVARPDDGWVHRPKCCRVRGRSDRGRCGGAMLDRRRNSRGFRLWLMSVRRFGLCEE